MCGCHRSNTKNCPPSPPPCAKSPRSHTSPLSRQPDLRKYPHADQHTKTRFNPIPLFPLFPFFRLPADGGGSSFFLSHESPIPNPYSLSFKRPLQRPPQPLHLRFHHVRHPRAFPLPTRRPARIGDLPQSRRRHRAHLDCAHRSHRRRSPSPRRCPPRRHPQRQADNSRPRRNPTKNRLQFLIPQQQSPRSCDPIFSPPPGFRGRCPRPRGRRGSFFPFPIYFPIFAPSAKPRRPLRTSPS